MRRLVHRTAAAGAQFHGVDIIRQSGKAGLRPLSPNAGIDKPAKSKA
jgi:hypothetical protein